MKVLMINGSPHKEGNTYIALHEMEKVFGQEQIETELIHVGNKDIRGCVACGVCHKKGACTFDDLVKYGDEKALREHGLIRSEGKDYIVKDGDVCLFKINA